jgi:hypothetical protein
MKKSIITIKPKSDSLQSTANIILSTSYNIVNPKNGSSNKRALTDSLEVVEVSKDKEVKKIFIDMHNKNNFEYSINLDRAGIDREKICKFFDEHPHTADITGRRSSEFDKPDAMFYYTISDELLDSKNDDDSEIVDTYLRFKSLSREEQDAISIYFGVAPWELDVSELMNEMVGLENGILTSSRTNRDDFKKKITTLYDVHTINLKAAILTNAVKTDGQAYIIIGQVLGNNYNEALSTLKAREDLYNAMLGEMRLMNVPVFYGVNGENPETKTSKKGIKPNLDNVPKGKFSSQEA